MTANANKTEQLLFNKIRDYQAIGKTIILVSHDTNAILRYCDIAILLDEGSLIDVGSSKKIIEEVFNILKSTVLCTFVTKHLIFQNIILMDHIIYQENQIHEIQLILTRK